jgi:hypothetical protein
MGLWVAFQIQTIAPLTIVQINLDSFRKLRLCSVGPHKAFNFVTMTILFMCWYKLPRVAITKCHKFDCLNNGNLLSCERRSFLLEAESLKQGISNIGSF